MSMVRLLLMTYLIFGTVLHKTVLYITTNYIKRLIGYYWILQKSYRGAEVLGYRGTEVQAHRGTEVQRYRGTDLQRYRGTEVRVQV